MSGNSYTSANCICKMGNSYVLVKTITKLYYTTKKRYPWEVEYRCKW